MKKVTTITPCYNGEKFIEKCWTSLKNQTIGIENMECIFVDDCSTDGTWDKLREIESEYPENVIVVQLPENRRQGGARNEALQYASGEYLQFLDLDDWLEPNALEDLYAMAKEYDTDIIQFDYVHPNGKDPNDNFCREEHFFDLTDPLERKDMLASGLMVCSHHNHFYRRALWERTGSYFAEHVVYEEPLFAFPMFITADRIMITTKEFYNKVEHKENTTETLLASRLEDHPLVQKMLLDFLMNMPDVMKTYREEIEFYFIFSYYVETVINIGCGGKLSLDVFCNMQKTVLEYFPNFEENRYLRNMIPVVEKTLDTIHMKIDSEEQMKRVFTGLTQEFYGA